MDYLLLGNDEFTEACLSTFMLKGLKLEPTMKLEL